MSIRPQIPEIEGVKDEKATTILRAIKTGFDMITGRTPNRPLIKKLGANATQAGIANKVNDIIDRLQG